MAKLAIFNALAMAIAIPGVSNAFLSASTVRFAGKSKMLLTRPVFMSAEGGSTREEFGKQTVAGLLAGLAAVAGVESAQAAGGKAVSRTASGARVNKDPVSLLQWGLPIDCKSVRQVQEAVEIAKLDLNQKNWGACSRNCVRAKSILTGNRANLLKAVGGKNEAEASKMLVQLDGDIGVLQKLMGDDLGSGPALDEKRLEEAFPAQSAIIKSIGDLEALMVPGDYPKKLESNIPEEFAELPRLLGRATAEFVIEKPKGEKFDVNGVLYDKVRLTMVLDGYTAPVTSGTMVDLIRRGYYNNLPITRSDGFVVQVGDPNPEGDVHDFFLPGSKEARKIPLEIAVTSDELPMYSTTTEDDGRGYAATKLPFQAYGALGMARSEYVADSASCQFFWLLFDSDLTPAGKNLLDGRYAEFGYTVENAELLADVKEGDVIKSAKILGGMENWKASASA